MTKKATGGPAFPTINFWEEKPIDVEPGMTLRDYFAGQAIAGLLADPNVRAEGIDVLAYRIADAMLEARK